MNLASVPTGDLLRELRRRHDEQPTYIVETIYGPVSDAPPRYGVYREGAYRITNHGAKKLFHCICTVQAVAADLCELLNEQAAIRGAHDRPA